MASERERMLYEGAECRRLWMAVLNLGAQDVIADSKKQRFCKEESPALRWLQSDEERPGSFVWLCCLFDIDPSSARAAVLSKCEVGGNYENV